MIPDDSDPRDRLLADHCLHAGQLDLLLHQVDRLEDELLGAGSDQRVDIGIDPTVAVGLFQNAEGWIVGLRLAALSMQSGSDPAEFSGTRQCHHDRSWLGRIQRFLASI